MTALVGGAAAGVLVAALVLVFGVGAAAATAIALAGLVIVAGAVDYVRTH